jgi:hypothetical protein
MARHHNPYGLHRCPCRGCEAMIPRLHVACTTCWPLAPRWLQQKVLEQLRYGQAYKCHPTDDFLKFRTELIEAVNRKLIDRYARPSPAPQLSLLPST